MAPRSPAFWRDEDTEAPNQAWVAMLIELSHTIEHGMITYRGLPAPLICDFLSREQYRQR